MCRDPRGTVAAMPLGKCPVLCSGYEIEKKKALRAVEIQWILYAVCNMYSNSKKTQNILEAGKAWLAKSC